MTAEVEVCQPAVAHEPHPAPTVSVVIPIYDRPQHIPGLVATLQQQTMTDWEAIIVDDCSPVAVATELQRFLGDQRIRLLRLDHNRGASAARNRGVAVARGRYIAFLDSDDRWHPEKLARQIRAIESDDRQDPAFCVTLTTILMPGGWTRVRANFDPRPDQSFAEYLYRDGGFAQVSSLMMPLDLARAIPFHEELRQYEDHLLFIELHAAGARYVVVREPLTIWENDDRPDRLSARDDLQRGAAFLASAGPLLPPRLQTAFRMRVLGGVLFRCHPLQAMALLLRTLVQGALGPTQLAALTARQILPTRVWDLIRRWAR